MTTAAKEVLVGTVKSIAKNQTVTTKAGKTMNKYVMVVTDQAGNDVFVSTLSSPFSPDLIQSEVSLEGKFFNEKNFNLSGEVNVTGEAGYSFDKPAGETPKATTASKGTDWAAKDRAQAIGGLMHDAANLVAPVITKTTKLEDIMSRMEETVLGLIDIKLKAEDKLKGE